MSDVSEVEELKRKLALEELMKCKQPTAMEVREVHVPDYVGVNAELQVWDK